MAAVGICTGFVIYPLPFDSDGVKVMYVLVQNHMSTTVRQLYSIFRAARLIVKSVQVENIPDALERLLKLHDKNDI